MRASTIMLVAVVSAVIGRWAHNKKAADGKTVVEATFAVLVIAFLDQGKTEPIAKGFAWLFLAAVLLGKDSPISILSAPLATAAGKGLAGAIPAPGATGAGRGLAGAAPAPGAAAAGRGLIGAAPVPDLGAGLERKKGH